MRARPDPAHAPVHFEVPNIPWPVIAMEHRPLCLPVFNEGQRESNHVHRWLGSWLRKHGRACTNNVEEVTCRRCVSILAETVHVALGARGLR
jgi:hypothetical protein